MNPDLWILDKIFEPMAQAIAKRTNIGNYTLSKWFFFLSTASMIVLILISLTKDYIGWGAIIVQFLYTWPSMSFASRLEQSWDGSEPPPNLRTPPENTREYELVFARHSLLYLPVYTGLTYWVLYMFFFRMHASYNPSLWYLCLLGADWLLLFPSFYFLACTPRPPRKKTERIPGGTPVLVPIRN